MGGASLGENGVARAKAFCNIFILWVILWGTTMVYASSFEDQGMVEGFGLGYALTAMPHSLDAANKNPALLSTIEHPSIGLTDANTFDSSASLVAFSAAKPMSFGTVGLFIPIRTVSDIPETKEEGSKGVQVGTLTDREADIKVGLSRDIGKNATFGVASAYHSHMLYNESASGYSVDVGGTYSGSFWRIGASITDLVNDLLWSTGKSEKSPLLKHAGLSVDLSKNAKISMDGDYNKSHVNVNLGINWKPSEYMDVVMGLKDALQQDRNLRIGINLRLLGAKFSYAMSDSIELGVTHKAGVVIEL